jgi:hypothetical protein
LSVSLLATSSCVTRKEVDAASWLNNFGVEEFVALCNEHPELKDFGFFRKLDDGTFQFLSACDPNAKRMISFKDEDLKKILDALLPQKKPK